MDKVYLIGEVGPNHNGSVETALTMIEKMAEAGVDCVKFRWLTPICSIVRFFQGFLSEEEWQSKGCSRNVPELPAQAWGTHPSIREV